MRSRWEQEGDVPRPTQDDHERFNDSLERCLAKSDFLDRFYEIFLASSPEVRAKFAATDFAKQKRMLQASLYMIATASLGRAEANHNLENLAGQHADLGIPRWMYDVWLSSLIEAVAEADSRFNRDIEASWRSVMGYGISVMVQRLT